MPRKSEAAKQRNRQTNNERQRERYQRDIQFQTIKQQQSQKEYAEKWLLGNMRINTADGESDNSAHYDQFGVYDGGNFYDLEKPNAIIALNDILNFLYRISHDQHRKDPLRKSNIYLMFSKHFDEDRWLGAEPKLTREQKLAINEQRSRRYGIRRQAGWQREIVLENLGVAVYFGRKETSLIFLKLDANGKVQYDENGNLCSRYTIKIWDTFSLTAMSFIKTIAPLFDVMSEDEKAHFQPLFDLVIEGKAERGKWSESFTYEKRKQYNHAELELMHYWLRHIIDACQRVGIAPKSLAGPAPFARSILYKYGAARHVQPLDYTSVDYQTSQAVTWTKAAYFGGRIETQLQGVVEKWSELDLSSAYPSIIKDLPCMAHGYWKFITPDREHIIDNAIYYIKFSAPAHSTWGPFPVRTKTGGIAFPLRGEGYYYGVEIKAALPYVKIAFFKGLQWISTCTSEHPFSEMVTEMFELRNKMQAAHDDGAALVIKLSINSLYGLFAQTAGAALITDENDTIIEYKLPKFYNLFGAGFVTASVRAQLYRTAMLSPDNVIGFATDALHLLGDIPDSIKKKVVITKPTHKKLGTWTFEKHGRTAFIAPGIRVQYIPPESDDATRQKIMEKNKGRGYPTQVTYEEVVAAWSRGERYLYKTRETYQDLRMTRKYVKDWGKFIPDEINLNIGPYVLQSKRHSNKPIPHGSYTLYPPYETVGDNYPYLRHFESNAVCRAADNLYYEREEYTRE